MLISTQFKLTHSHRFLPQNVPAISISQKGPSEASHRIIMKFKDQDYLDKVVKGILIRQTVAKLCINQFLAYNDSMVHCDVKVQTK